MDVVITDKNRKDIGDIGQYANVTFDPNKEKRFTVQIARDYYNPEFTYGSWVYIPNTEFGGAVDKIMTSTTLDYVELSGYTARGKLSTIDIPIPSGKAYRTESGDIYTIMRNLVNSRFSGLIRVVGGNYGVSLTNYQFDRYGYVLDGINKMLKSVGLKLCCKCIRNENTPVYIALYADRIRDYSDSVEFSNDNLLSFTLEEERGGVNHLIALGKGELTDRVVIHKYIDQNGNVSNTQYYTGFDEVVSVYDYSSAESADLEKKAEEKILSLASKKKMGINIVDISYELSVGDIVGGRDYLTGLYNSKPIENVIYTVNNGVETIKYKLEGER